MMIATDHAIDYDPYELYDDPYPVYRMLREEAPVYRNETRGFYALSRYSDIQAAARDPRTFSNAEGVDIGEHAKLFGPGNFLDSDPPRHDELRAVVRDTFVPKAILALEPAIRAEAGRLADQCVERGQFDFAVSFAWALPVAMITRILGLPPGDRDLVQEWASQVLELERGGTEVALRARRSLSEMRDYLKAAVVDRRSRPRDDLLSQVATARPGGELLSEDEMLGMCSLLIVAGIETTAGLLSNSILVLAEHPDQRRAIAEEHGRIPAAIEELLRYEPPVQWLSRVTTTEAQIQDVSIPRGSRVLLLWASANRDEDRFEAGDSFDIGREPKRHLSFGEGIHFCVGAPLARLEARIAFEELFRRRVEYEVAGPVIRAPIMDARAVASLPVAC